MASTNRTDKLLPGQSKVTVTGTTASGTSNAFTLGRSAKITMQAVGTWGGATFTLQASNDGTNFVALPTTQQFTADGIKSAARDGIGYAQYRWSWTGGDGTTSVTLTLVGTEASG